jgi:hypothetical protein
VPWIPGGSRAECGQHTNARNSTPHLSMATLRVVLSGPSRANWQFARANIPYRRGEHMDIMSQLKAEREKAAQQVNALDTAIRALSGMNNTRVSHGPRKMSAAARARISASQKARWARTRGQKVVSIAPKATERRSKRHISAAGLANIRKATKARWRKWRAAQK